MRITKGIVMVVTLKLKILDGLSQEPKTMFATNSTRHTYYTRIADISFSFTDSIS